ncbi:hypothetical protein ACGYLO_11145 [Sulfitobacter sp. 1A13353]|uniref:hypothetical protein n=1 Tax=Sulfitobacter sp. 1A13353 TaxID=3368568 RepID=UPI0037462292
MEFINRLKEALNTPVNDPFGAEDPTVAPKEMRAADPFKEPENDPAPKDKDDVDVVALRGFMG